MKGVRDFGEWCSLFTSCWYFTHPFPLASTPCLFFLFFCCFAAPQ
jgi:hypothetical protein